VNAVEWPDGRPCAVAVTVDVDAETMWTSRDPANARRPVVLSQATFEIDYGVPAFLDLFDAVHARTTFFVPGWVAQRHPHVVELAAARGHEIANHGYDHARMSQHPPEVERWMITTTNDILSSLSDAPVVGYRAPYFEVSDQTLRVLQDLGMHYTSNFMNSLFPYQHEGTRLLELPVSWMWDDGPYYLFATEPPNFRQMYRPDDVTAIWRAEFDEIRRIGGVMTLILHPQLSARPSRLAALRGLLEEMAESGAWMASASEICEWARNKVGSEMAATTDSRTSKAKG
jgi:peptidoglycan/xylan/chitin deacetylase (PgdA/CDA1 family)